MLGPAAILRLLAQVPTLWVFFAQLSESSQVRLDGDRSENLRRLIALLVWRVAEHEHDHLPDRKARASHVMSDSGPGTSTGWYVPSARGIQLRCLRFFAIRLPYGVRMLESAYGSSLSSTTLVCIAISWSGLWAPCRAGSGRT